MHEGNSQQLYHKFLDFCSSQKKTLMFHHLLEKLYNKFVESYIDQEHILIDMVIFLLLLTHFFSFKMIRNES